MQRRDLITEKSSSFQSACVQNLCRFLSHSSIVVFFRDSFERVAEGLQQSLCGRRSPYEPVSDTGKRVRQPTFEGFDHVVLFREARGLQDVLAQSDSGGNVLSRQGRIS